MVDSKGYIVDIRTSEEIEVSEGNDLWKEIQNGNEYMNSELMNSNGIYLYAYSDGCVAERDSDSINSDTKPLLISQKKREISNACEEAITAGFDYHGEHYSMTLEDQSNMLSLLSSAENGSSVIYHADGKECREYTSSEFIDLFNEANKYKEEQMVYCNLLMRQIEQMEYVIDIMSVTYGVTELNEAYSLKYNEIIGS